MYSSQMNVALVIDDIIEYPPKNGVTYRFYHAAKHLMNRDGIHVIIADRGGTEIQKLKNSGLKATFFPSKWLYDPQKTKDVLDIFRSKNINIIHVCNAHTMVPQYGFNLHNQLEAALVCDMHDIYADLLPQGPEYEEARKQEALTQRIVGKYADKIGVISKLDLAKLVNDGIDASKMNWAPVGVNVREAPHTNNIGNKVVFVGNMFYGPNYDAAKLISSTIAPRVKKHIPDASFILVGNAPEDLKGLANIELVGPKDNLSRQFSDAALGLAPLTSGSGMKVKMLEYASHGLPVVGTTVAASGYEDNDGFIIRDNIDDFIKEIVRLLNDPDEILVIGAAAKKYAEENFSWDRIVDGQYNLYKALYEEKNICANFNPIPFVRDEDGRIIVDNKILVQPQHLQELRYEHAERRQIDRVISI